MKYMKEENEKIPSDDELKIKYPPSKKFEKKLMKAIKTAEYGQSLHIIRMKRVAVAVLICFSAFFAILLSSVEVRAAVQHTVMEWYDKYVNFNFNFMLDNNNFPENVSDVEFMYIPDLFELEYRDKNITSIQEMYFDTDGNELLIDVMQSDIGAVMVDNEHHTYEKLKLEKRTVHFFYDTEENYGVAIIGNSSCVATVQGHLSREELIKIVKNIK